MKREILFRAKRVDGNGWVESMTISYGIIKRKRHLLYMQVGDDIWVQVIPESVCQFTGLTDKNGTKVFEGDKIEWSDVNGIEDGNGCIEFDFNHFSFIASIDEFDYVSFYDLSSDEIEVIGNIHEK